MNMKSSGLSVPSRGAAAARVLNGLISLYTWRIYVEIQEPIVGRRIRSGW
jgi:hypothetical protein